jgi:hypothetical protein
MTGRDAPGARTFRLLQGFIAVTGMLFQEFEYNVPIAPATDAPEVGGLYPRAHPYLGK